MPSLFCLWHSILSQINDERKCNVRVDQRYNRSSLCFSTARTFNLLVCRIRRVVLMADGYRWVYALPPAERNAIELRYDGRIPKAVCNAARKRVEELQQEREAKT